MIRVTVKQKVVVSGTVIQKVQIASQSLQGPQGVAGPDGGQSTGLVFGSDVTINTDNTLFDVAAGEGVIVDDSDPANLVIHNVTWDDITEIVPTYLASAATTYLFIDVNGNVIQSLVFPSGVNIRNKIQIGSIVHGNNVNISGTSDFCSAPIYNIAATMTDTQVAMGVINTAGNTYEGDPAGNLKLQKNSGVMTYLGIIRKAQPGNPNNIVSDKEVAPVLLQTWRDGGTGFNTTESDTITAGVYDNNGGGVSAPSDVLSVNKWTPHRLFFSPDANVTVLQYGQTSYNSDSAAIAGAALESFTQDPEFIGVPFRGYLVMRGGATDLTNVADAVYINANKFGF